MTNPQIQNNNNNNETKRNVLNAAYQRSQLRPVSRAVFQPLQLSRFSLRP